MVTDLRKSGKTIILSTHNMNDVEELCDRVLMMDNGRAILAGDLAHIRARYPAPRRREIRRAEPDSLSLNEIFLKALGQSHA